MNDSRTGRVDDHDEDKRQHQRRAEVRLDHDQTREHRGDESAGNEGAPEVSFFTRAFLEEVGEKNYQREFCNLRWLKRKARQLDPAMRAVATAETKHRDQRDAGYEQQTVHDAAVL